jgi:GTPase SAR1 family protein
LLIDWIFGEKKKRKKRKTMQIDISQCQKATFRRQGRFLAEDLIGSKMLWVDDSHSDRCFACDYQFRLFSRRHHCRFCGGLFDAQCSRFRQPIPELGYAEPVRVCQVCDQVLGEARSALQKRLSKVQRSSERGSAERMGNRGRQISRATSLSAVGVERRSRAVGAAVEEHDREEENGDDDEAMRLDRLERLALLHIFSYMPVDMLVCVLPLVCRRFNAIARDPTLWRRLYLRRFAVDDDRSAIDACGIAWRRIYLEKIRRQRLETASAATAAATSAVAMPSSSSSPAADDDASEQNDVDGDESNEASKIDVVLVGATGTGKSSILQRYVYNRFSDDVPSSMSASFGARNIHARKGGCHIVSVKLWQTSGDLRFRSLAPMYYRKAHIVIVTYSAVDASTFSDAEQLLSDLAQLERRPLLALVGTMIDLVGSADHERRVPSQIGQSLASRYNVALFRELSVRLDNGDIDSLIGDLVSILFSKSSSN